MIIDDRALQNEEKAVFSLRELYGRYGYSQYKMSKFEEYDLYVRNKDYLISDSIITFTDTNGKLMAMKPDVTLSIIKNLKDKPEYIQKLYYNENVYRVSKGTHSFREIMQLGLECIGNVDSYCIYEVLMLAAESLRRISKECVLDISHLGIISSVLDNLGVDGDSRAQVIKCIGEKNFHEISGILEANGVPGEKTEILRKLIATYGTPDEVIPQIKLLPEGIVDKSCVDSLVEVVTLLNENGYGDVVRIDFSVINDMNYYNGIVFRGFVDKVPTGILSGGQYDKLMKKMNHTSSAIGFAVYLDMLERLDGFDNGYDVDAVILYDDNSDIVSLNNTVKLLTESGKSVSVQRRIPEKMRYKELLKLNERGVEILENNA